MCIKFKVILLLLMLGLISLWRAGWAEFQIEQQGYEKNINGFPFLFDQVSQIESFIQRKYAITIAEELRRFHFTCNKLLSEFGEITTWGQDFGIENVRRNYPRYRKYPYRVALILVYLNAENFRLQDIIQRIGNKEEVEAALERQRMMKLYSKEYFHTPVDLYVSDSVYALRRLAKTLNDISLISNRVTINEGVEPKDLKYKADIIHFIVTEIKALRSHIKLVLQVSNN